MAFDEAEAPFRALDLFADFNDEQIRLLTFVSEERELAPGDVLYEAGQLADGGYVLTRGLLQASHGESADGFSIRPPSLVGEIGLMLARPRPSTVVARQTSRLLFVPREPFLKLLRADPDLAESVAAILRAELSRYLEQITAVGPRFSG